MNTLTELIKNFLSTYCTVVSDNDDAEVMMDNHKCIEYDGVEYYVPENSVLYTDEDYLLIELLVAAYEVK